MRTWTRIMLGAGLMAALAMPNTFLNRHAASAEEPSVERGDLVIQADDPEVFPGFSLGEDEAGSRPIWWTEIVTGEPSHPARADIFSRPAEVVSK